MHTPFHEEDESMTGYLLIQNYEGGHGRESAFSRQRFRYRFLPVRQGVKALSCSGTIKGFLSPSMSA